MPLLAIIGGLALLAAMLTATTARAQEPDEAEDEELAPAPALDISVTAEATNGWLPIYVTATDVTEGEDGLPTHGVSVSWFGGGPIYLDDARFTHHVEGDDGDLVTAGRGCGVEWSEETESVEHICTADLQEVKLGFGATHEYPVTIHPEVGPLMLEPGTYEVEETIGWWLEGDAAPRGEITISLTYEVEEGAAEPGSDAVDAAVADLAASEGVDAETIEVARVEDVTWSDGCLGVPEPDQVCTQALVPGHVVWLVIGHQAWQYHTDHPGDIVIAAAGPFPATWVPGMPIPPGTVADDGAVEDGETDEPIEPEDSLEDESEEPEDGLGDVPQLPDGEQGDLPPLPEDGLGDTPPLPGDDLGETPPPFPEGVPGGTPPAADGTPGIVPPVPADDLGEGVPGGGPEVEPEPTLTP